MFLWNTGKLIPDYMASHTKKWYVFYSSLWEPRMIHLRHTNGHFNVLTNGLLLWNSVLHQYYLTVPNVYFFEPGYCRQYGDWLWAGWLRGQSWSPGRAKNFLHIVQPGSGAHPASCPVGTGGSFPSGKAAGAWSWPLNSKLVLRSGKSGSIHWLPHMPS
jgi:hypothetical protein